MFHKPEVRPAAFVSDTVTVPVPLAESVNVPAKTVGAGPGTNARNGLGVEELILQPEMMRHADAKSPAYMRSRVD
jgi:hypothetical protein